MAESASWMPDPKLNIMSCAEGAMSSSGAYEETVVVTLVPKQEPQIALSRPSRLRSIIDYVASLFWRK